MAVEAESDGLHIRLPVHYGAITGLVYAPEVDAVILSTVVGSILVYDASSFKLLFENKLGEGALSCVPHRYSGRLVVTDGRRLGARSARGGLLYMPTFLQTTASPEEEVVLDIPHGEASTLLESLRATTEVGKWTSVKDSGKEELLASLEEASTGEARPPHCGTRTEWKFAAVRSTCSLLRAALTSTTPQGRLLQTPICHELLARELVLEREGDGEKVYQIEAGRMGAEFLTSLPNSMNNMEALRKLSLVEWPLKDHRWATPSTLAAAGFHKSTKQDTVGWYGGGDNDLVTCFHCYKSLRSWEPCDEPWSEHTRHFPECSFITGQRTTNVPLSVTMATTPATTLAHQHVDEPPILSVSWGCPFVGVASKNGTIAVYNVGQSFYLHQHCAPIQLSAEALTASLKFEETVNGMNSSLVSCSPGGVLEKALDGIKLALADLQDIEDIETTMATDALGPVRTSGSSLTVSACCVVQSPSHDRPPVAPAVVVGCSLAPPGERRSLLVAYTLVGRKEGAGDLSYPATTSLNEIVPIPAMREIEGKCIVPTITDIVPCAGGRYLAVNVVYEEIRDKEQNGSTAHSEANEKGCLLEPESGPCVGDPCTSSSCNIVCSQTLLFELKFSEDAIGKDLSPPRLTSVGKSPVGRRVSHSPGTTFTKLTQLVETSDGDSKEAVRLVGVTVDGRIRELVGEELNYGMVVVLGSDPVVLCAPCTSSPNQLVVVRESSRMELVSLTRDRSSTSVGRGEGLEETDYSSGVETDGTREMERQERVKSHLNFAFLKSVHSSVTGIGEEGLPFLSLAPPHWREISSEQKDRGFPQHVHQPLKGEKEEFKKVWMIPWRTEAVESPLMVLEVTKPQQGCLAQLNVQLQSEVPESLIGLSVSLLAVRGPRRSREGGQGIGQEESGGSGDALGVLAGDGTGGASFSMAHPATVDDLCRRSNSVCVCGPIRCRDCLGIMQQEVTLALYHSSLWDSKAQKYLIVLEVSPGANVERATPTSAGKGKENVILSVAFLPSVVHIPPEEKSRLHFILLQPAFVQFLLVLSAGGKVLGEEFSSLYEEVQHWMRDQCAEDIVGAQADDVRYSAMEVLCYLAGREVHQTDRNHCRVLLTAVSPVLRTLLYTCFLHGTRLLAYRTSRFIRLCLRLARALCEGINGEDVFSSALHCALLSSLPLLPSTSCAVGMRCLCDLLGAMQPPEDLTDTVSSLLQVCGTLLDSVGSLSVIPALQGMAAAETSVINLNFDPYMFDGGLPSLLCLSADSGNNKPSLEYSSTNHNNEMKLFCSGGTCFDHTATAGRSFTEMLGSGGGNGNKRYKELMCSSMKMAPFLRQPQAGALDSFEIAYVVRGYSHCEPIQAAKQGAKDSAVPFPSLKSGNHLLRGVLKQNQAHHGHAGHRTHNVGGTAVPLGMIEKIASKEPVDVSTVRSQMACLEESLFSNFEIGGRKVEVASARSGQSFSAILDFRLPIRLTDVCIPTNPLLSSVSVDVWLMEGETPLRVLHARDLSSKSVSLGNLSPPPLCQFAKVTFAVGTGKSSPSLVVDLGLYCGQLVLPLLSPSVLHRLYQLTIQLQSHFAAVTEQLNTVLEYLVKAPPTVGDPVAMEMINLTKQMTRDAGSLQFTVSVLQSVWSQAIEQHAARPRTVEPLGGTSEPLEGAPEPLVGAPEPLGGTSEPIGGTSEPIGGTPEPIRGAPEPLGGTPEPIGGIPEPLQGAPEPIGGEPEPLEGAPEPIGGTPEPLGSAPEPHGGAPEPLGGAPEHTPEPQTGLREYLINPTLDTPGWADPGLSDGCVPCNQWFSIARRLINKLTCLLARLKRASLPTPSNNLTRQQAKSMFYVLGLQCYAKVSARAMSVIVDNCATSPWWPELIQELVQEVTHDQRSLFYDKERAFALLSGFILHSSSPAIVDCLLCLLEERFSSCQQDEQEATSTAHTQEGIATYHWLLMVFCDAISSVIPSKSSDLLSMERCHRVSKGIVNLIIQLVASSNPSSGETVLIGCKAILLLSKASCPALTLCDVFSEESLCQYLTICCRSWGGGAGEGQSPSVWLTAMESVVLEIFEMECSGADIVITGRPVNVGDNTSLGADTSAKSSPSQTPRRNSATELERRDPTMFTNPSHQSDMDSDEEFLGYLAKKAGIDPTSSYFTEDQYWPGKHLLQRYARRKKVKTKESSPSNQTDDPPYSTYIVSGTLDHRLGASFELVAEKDMQVAWKEEYWNTLYFIAACGPASVPPRVPRAAGVHADGPFAVLAGLKASQALLSTVLVRLAGCCSEPFSQLSPVALIRLWWGVTRLTLFSSNIEDPSKAICKHFFFVEAFIELQARREQKGVDDSKPTVDPAEVVSICQLACQLGFLPHILQLIKDSPTDADGLMQGLKIVTTILAAQMGLYVKFGRAPPVDGSASIDLEPLGITLESLFKRTVSHTQLEIVSHFVQELCKYYEEAPVVEEEEGSTKDLKFSGMLIVIERVAQFLRNTEPQEALQNRALVSAVDLLLDFYQRAAQPSKETGGEETVRDEERGILRAIYSSQLLERFRKALKSLLELVLRTMLFHYGERGQDPVTMYTQDVAMRRYGDPSRNSWTEAHKSKTRTSHGLMAMCGIINHFVQWESNRGEEDPAISIWEELTKADAFIGMLLRVYLLCVSSKPETDDAPGSNALTHVRALVLQISASRLVQPIIGVLQWCGRGQVGLLPHFLELVEFISSREGDKEFMELLLEKHALEAAVEGFLSSCSSHLPSEPSPLQLPYIWHLFRVNGNDELKNLSEFVSEPSHRVKLLLKGGRMRLAEGIQGTEPLAMRFKQPVIIHNIQLLNNMHSNGPRAVEVVVKAMEYSPEMSVTGVVQNPGGDSIKLDLHSLPLVTELRITLWRAPSASAIFLSGVHIIGQPFQVVPHTKIPNTAAPSNSWLSFLHWWLQQKNEAVQVKVEQTLAEQCVPLAQGCLQLLTVGANPAVLRFLVQLAGLSERLSSALVCGLLRREPTGQFDPLLLLMGSISLEASMELLKLLCAPDTELGLQRMERMLQLVVELAQAPLEHSPHPLLVKCLASLVWLYPDKHITPLQEADHTRSLADFAFRLPVDSPLKVAYNSLLCSLCAHPLSQPLLEELFDVGQKQFGEGDTSRGRSIDDGFLSTLASLLQSHPVMEHFLHSKLAGVVLVQLHQSLQELQTALSATSPWQQPAIQSCLMTAQLLLVFVTGLAARMQLAKSWLGKEAAAPTWTLLLATATATARLENRTELKHLTDLAFEFFARCCEHHKANKALLALLLKDHVQSCALRTPGVSPLHHRLLNSVVLGVDRIPVVIQVERGNGNEGIPLQPLPLLVSHHAPEHHPSLGAGNSAYISYLPTTMPVDSLLATISGCPGQPGTERAAVKTNSTTATAAVTPWDMYNMDIPAMMDHHPESLLSPSPLQVVNVHSPMMKKLPSRTRRRYTLTKPPSVPGSTSYQLGLQPPGKSPLFVPLNCLTFGDLQQALCEAGLAEDNPLALHLVYRPSVQLQDLPDSDNMDAAMKHLATSLQQCFRKKTKPSNSHTQPITEDATPAPSPPCPPSGSIPRLLTETRLLEIVAAILPQLYGSLWPRLVGMESQEEGSVAESIIAAPPGGVPFHSVVMLGLGMGLSEVCLQLTSDTSMDSLVMVKVVLGGSLNDVLSELNYTSVDKKKFACLPYQLVEQVLSKKGSDQVLSDGELGEGPVEKVISQEGLDHGLVERCFACGVLHHVLGCLRHLGSHASRDKGKDVTAPSSYVFQSSNEGGADLSAGGSGQKFFAKGTGFGSGSLRSGWDMEQVREAQKENEHQVECCLKIFSAYMDGVSPTSALWERRPHSLHDIVAWSALLPALAAYLFNDSVLDMAQHVPLYLAVFAVVLSLSRQPRLVGLLLERPYPGEAKEPASSIFSLMERMKSTAEQYQKAARLATQRLPKPAAPLPTDPTPASDPTAQPSTEDKDTTAPVPLPSAPPLPTATGLTTGLTPPLLPKGLGPEMNILATGKETERKENVSDGVLQLVHAIESTWVVLQEGVAALRSQRSWETDHDDAEENIQKTASEVYMETMRPLQFDSSEMTSVGEDGAITCLVPYHYAGYLESAVEPVGGARAMRITQEITTLANSLPLSASSSVFIRCDEERFDVMKVLITGPADTPYANGCYLFDVFFPRDYPNRPMLVNLQTTGHGTVRFNPNLYADGKVCLSVLNTWSGRPEEKWNPMTSSMLQVLVSIQSLILVAEPYFNEPGYERQRGTPQGDDQNMVYNAVVSSENVRWAILEQIINPAEPFRQVILQHFYLKQHEVLRQCREWRRLFADAVEKRKHLTTVTAKLKILDSLLPQLERKLAELKPEQFQSSTGT